MTPSSDPPRCADRRRDGISENSQREGRTPSSDRGQAFTLEGFAAALLLLASVIYALQVTAVTPLTASTSSQHIENQQAGVAGGMLNSAVENGTLKPALLYWNETSQTFHGTTDEGYYALGGPPNTIFGSTLNRTFRDRGIAVNVNVWYVTDGGRRRAVDMVSMGVPSDNAVAVRRSVTLYDDDPVYNADGQASDTTLNETSDFYAPEASSKSPVYHVVVVEVVTWRM